MKIGMGKTRDVTDASRNKEALDCVLNAATDFATSLDRLLRTSDLKTGTPFAVKCDAGKISNYSNYPLAIVEIHRSKTGTEDPTYTLSVGGSGPITPINHVKRTPEGIAPSGIETKIKLARACVVQFTPKHNEQVVYTTETVDETLNSVMQAISEGKNHGLLDTNNSIRKGSKTVTLDGNVEEQVTVYAVSDRGMLFLKASIGVWHSKLPMVREMAFQSHLAALLNPRYRR